MGVLGEGKPLAARGAASTLEWWQNLCQVDDTASTRAIHSSWSGIPFFPLVAVPSISVGHESSILSPSPSAPTINCRSALSQKQVQKEVNLRIFLVPLGPISVNVYE